MGTFSIWHWLVVLAVVVLLFGGGGKMSRLMGDFGRGIKSFKKSIKDDGTDSAPVTGDGDDGDDAKVLRSADDEKLKTSSADKETA